MPAQCGMPGCADLFDDGLARHDAQSYRRKGLDKISRAVAETVTAGGVHEATVLEIGGGVGGLSLELLKAGAASAVVTEVSAAYEPHAHALLREAALESRGRWVLANLASDGARVGEADVVVLNRVVCCYPDFAGLLGAAGRRARRLVVFSHPRRNLISKAALRVENFWHRARGRCYRAYVHPPEAMLAVLEREGLRLAGRRRHGLLWEITVTERV